MSVTNNLTQDNSGDDTPAVYTAFGSTSISSFIVILCSLLFTLAGTVLQASAAVVTSPSPQCIAVATLQSAEADHGSRERYNGSLFRFKVVMVLKQPSSGPNLSKGAAVVEHMPQVESDIQPWQMVSSDLGTEDAPTVYLLYIAEQDGEFVTNWREAWPIPNVSQEKIVEIEANGYADVERMKRLPTGAERVGEFTRIARSSSIPSLVLVLAMRQSIDYRVTEESRVVALQGLASIIGRKDVPAYIRGEALSTLGPGGIIYPGDIAAAKITVPAVLDAFHLEVLAPEDRMSFVAQFLYFLLREHYAINTTPELRTRMDGLRSDLQLYDKNMANIPSRILKTPLGGNLSKWTFVQDVGKEEAVRGHKLVTQVLHDLEADAKADDALASGAKKLPSGG